MTRAGSSEHASAGAGARVPRDLQHACGSAEPNACVSPAARVPEVPRDASSSAAQRVSPGQADACRWCAAPLPPRRSGGIRPGEARWCSPPCRAAGARFRWSTGRAAALPTDAPRRLAVADPPYPGKAHLYRGHPDFGGEVDHVALLHRLAAYDGWALATSADALPAVLHACVALALPVRVASWHRGHRPGRSTEPLGGWEPVIYVPARAHEARDDQPVDTLHHVARPRRADPARVIGAKPAAWCGWVFSLVQARPMDQLDDLFPGSGGVSRAWRDWCAP